MQRTFPWLALGLGLLLSLILWRYAATDAGAGYRLPLLTGLLLAEFGFLVTAVAAGACARDLVKQGLGRVAVLLLVGNLLLALNFARLGLQLWAGATG